MNHKLAVYWAPQHGQNEILDNIRALKPPAIVVLGQDVQHISDAFAASPNSYIIPRVWEIDDFHGNAVAEMNSNPKQAARWHFERLHRLVQMWKAQAFERGLPFPDNEQILYGGANEPNQGADYHTIKAYASEYGTVAKSYKCRALLTRLGVGHPKDLLPNGAVDWKDFEGLDAVIKAGGHFLELHQYWQGEGPDNGEDYFYLAGRHHWVPWNVPIFIGECGVDGGIFNRFPKQGWQGGDIGLSQQQFLDQVIYVHERVGEHVMGMALFSWDFQNSEDWATFDIRPMMKWLEGYANDYVESIDAVQVVLPVPEPKPTPRPPTIPKPPVEHITLLDPIFLQAVLNVESGGRARAADERMIIRFEAHIFESFLNNPDIFNKYFQIADRQPWKAPQYYRTDPTGDWKMIHTGNQDSEYKALDVARGVASDYAYQSISMGAPQIMGFHYERLGYPTAAHMFRAMDSSDLIQIATYFNFLFADRRLVQAIFDNDFVTFAKIYNGSEEYALGLIAEYQRLMKLNADTEQQHLPFIAT